MAKTSIFRNFFKLIFSLVGVALAVIAVGFFFGPFVVAQSAEILGASASITITGFSLAFGGEMTFTANFLGNSNSSTLPYEDSCIGTQVGFYFLLAGALFAVIYLIFCWGKKGVSIKKAIGSLSALCLLVAGILFFATVPLAGLQDSTTEVAGETYTLATSNLGYGAILSGIGSLLGFLAMLIASFLGPKEA